MKDLTGTRLGQYEIVERLGGGGMAVVYRAVQQPLGREIALKALSSELFQDEGFVKRFETEAKTLAKLDHPNILPIYDFEVMDGNTFLTMPLIRGGTLRDVLNRGPLDALTAWRYLREIGDGLQHAHDAGIVHRDLKPTNVLIHTDGRAMLADFGLARGAGQPTHLTTIGLAIGTPGYMAPEQVMGHDVDKRADVYAMGVLTFEMLTGRLPFVGSNRMEVAYATVNNPIPSAVKINPNLPDELDALLQKVLAKDPGQRPQTVRELLAQMARLPQRRTSPPGVAAASPLATAATPAGGVAVLPRPGPRRTDPGPTDDDEDRRRSSACAAAGDHPRLPDPDSDRRARLDDQDPRAHGSAARESARTFHPQLTLQQLRPRRARRHRGPLAGGGLRGRTRAVHRAGRAARRAALVAGRIVEPAQ